MMQGNLMTRRLPIVLGFFLVIPYSLVADVRLPSLLTSQMVLQRDVPLHFWGMASPAEKVSVSFHEETQTTEADEFGRWSVYLKPVTAGGPFSLTVRGMNRIVLEDIWVGDVWIAAGQSNMELPLKETEGAKEEIATAQNPRIRFFRVQKNTAAYPLEDVSPASWEFCSPETVPAFSAVAYYFGKQIFETQKIPLGFIDASWGGTPLASFTSLEAISRDASLMPVFSHWSNMAGEQATTLLQLEKERKEVEEAAAKARSEGKEPPGRPWHPDFEAWAPAAIYNGMIAPLTRYPIRGAIWYQGESDASPERSSVYSRLFQAMIRDWRQAWGVGDFPFFFVQLANWEAGPGNAWPEIREAQRETLALRNTGMAVTIDAGDAKDIHPRDKKTVGLRLALAARAIAYGEEIEYSGPLFRQTTVAGQSLRIWFDHVGVGLVAKGGEVLKGFEIAGAEGKFEKAEARIEGTTVVVSHSAVPHPRRVRYGWADNPEVNLLNQAGLPASPFSSTP
jgi:sialate O-acetylesterase